MEKNFLLTLCAKNFLETETPKQMLTPGTTISSLLLKNKTLLF
jgi:hypothetical protein